ncbi:MAG: LytTR family DNA-binding domain-containing protein [Marinobacter sp.]
MTSQRILIADDEPLARDRLRRLVEGLPGYSVCGEAADGDKTLQAVAELKPDIVLLDIRMPGADGMDVAAHLSQLERPPAVIFCTAYDHYALQAFEVNASAYLMKPLRKDALATALQRAAKTNRLQQPPANTAPATVELAVRTYRGTELIDLTSLIYCQADQKYVTLHHLQGDVLCDYTLKELEQHYGDHLIRVHRNTLVGTRFIQALHRSTSGQTNLVLRDGLGELQVSRRHASELRQWLHDYRPGRH